jgi:hypothetical protein
VIVALELVLLTAHGILYPRSTSYPNRDWIGALVAKTSADRSRVYSSDAFLFPGTATVYGLQDPRLLDALYVDRYWRYLKTFIARHLVDRFTGIDSKAAAQIADNPMFDLLGVRYLVYDVQRASAPPVTNGNQFVSILQSGRGHIYENTHAIARAFVVHELRPVANADAAFKEMQVGSSRFADGTRRVSFNPKQTAIVETANADLRSVHPCGTDVPDRAHIVSYQPDRVTLRVHASCPGLLVLTDSYYPGWNAAVNGTQTPIHATDGAFRGVAIPAGNSTIVFRYQPRSFRNGILLAALSLIAIIGLGVSDLRRRRRPHSTPLNHALRSR